LEEAIAKASAAADEMREAALDPISWPDANKARGAVEAAAFTVARLSALLPRLEARRVEVGARERRAQWQADYEALKPKRDALAKELGEVYPEVVAKLIDLFARIAQNDAELSQLHRRRAAGVSLHLDGAEVVSRGLKAYTRDKPELAKTIELFGFDGERLWPPRRTVDPSLFAPAPHDARYSRDWAQARNDRAEAIAEEQARVARYYEQQERLQQEREQREAEAARRAL